MAAQHKSLHKTKSDAQLPSNSVFHTALVPPPVVTPSDGLTGVVAYAESLLEACRAGTRASDALLLAGLSTNGETAGQFAQLQRGLETAMTEVLDWVRAEVQGGVATAGGSDNNTVQVLRTGLLLLAHIQQQFFTYAADRLATFTQTHGAAPNGLPADPTKSKDGGRLPQKLSALLAKWKGDPQQSRSSWYVALDGKPTDKGQSAGQTPSAQTKSKQDNGVLDKNGPKSDTGVQSSDTVSQEELDVVINVLSRATKYNQPDADPVVRTKGSAPPTSAGLLRAPGSQLTSSPPSGIGANTVTVSSHPAYKSRATQHRQSEGFITEAAVSRESKTNTWPSRPRQKDSGHMTWMPGDPEFSMPLNGHHPGFFSPRNPAGVPMGKLHPLFNAGPWSTAPEEQSAYKGWPPYPNMGEGEAAPRQWTNVADSSSCSDESSSNGELQQWMMGMNLIEAVNMKRRHSSGGEEMALPSMAAPNIAKSTDNLMEPKSTNTWPPKQPWGPRASSDALAPMGFEAPDLRVVGPGKNPAMPPPHRPLMPQWSDPVASRPLPLWGEAGLTGSLSQQSFSTLPVAPGNGGPLPEFTPGGGGGLGQRQDADKQF